MVILLLKFGSVDENKVCEKICFFDEESTSTPYTQELIKQMSTRRQEQKMPIAMVNRE